MGEVAAENIMGIPAVYDEKTNPTCVYMEPEAASVGLTEEQCKAKGIDYKVGKFPLVANGQVPHHQRRRGSGEDHRRRQVRGSAGQCTSSGPVPRT